MSKGEVVLLDCWASPFCLRAKIALAEKGVEYEARAENLFGGKSDLLLKSNPICQKSQYSMQSATYGKPRARSPAKNEFVEILKQLEGALGEKDFFGGDSFGFVDVIAIPLTCWFYAVEEFGGFKVENECPKFSAWMNKCMQRDTVARILPDPEKVYEFVIMLRNMFGIE
ncbi:probable glutathione S-transferase [Citrus sinensis]|uniref:probable glutathione S-transferase n=1 Tax=Citrus sinensis TaxID=2711 RepID=UPI00227765F1|nr:probable glutathione S-transferase [Citrus sinensis]